jgi:hypothetical protein
MRISPISARIASALPLRVPALVERTVGISSADSIRISIPGTGSRAEADERSMRKNSAIKHYHFHWISPCM